MSLKKKDLQIKPSTIPDAGKGLFTKIDITKGTIVTEYKGRRRTWKDVENDVDNGYIYHIDDDNVIDAKANIRSHGRYANDAAGLTKIKGITNNAEYVELDNKVFIRTKKDIAAGCEVFVAYGKLYWKQVKENMEEDLQKSKNKK